MYRKYLKRPTDIIVAATALLFLSPVIAAVGVWLHFANKGAGAFFSQLRI